MGTKHPYSDKESEAERSYDYTAGRGHSQDSNPGTLAPETMLCICASHQIPQEELMKIPILDIHFSAIVSSFSGGWNRNTGQRHLLCPIMFLYYILNRKMAILLYLRTMEQVNHSI